MTRLADTGTEYLQGTARTEAEAESMDFVNHDMFSLEEAKRNSERRHEQYDKDQRAARC